MDEVAKRREHFFGALALLGPISVAARNALEPLLIPRAFDAGQTLLRAGQLASHCFFIHSGLVRELYLGADGREHTRAFIHEGQLTGSLLDLLSKQPAVTFIKALEQTITLAFDYAEFDRLCGYYPDLEHSS